MSMSRHRVLAVAVAALLSGCSFADDTLSPTGTAPSAQNASGSASGQSAAPPSSPPAPSSAATPPADATSSWLPSLEAPDPRGSGTQGATASNPAPAPNQSAPAAAAPPPRAAAAATTSTSTVTPPRLDRPTALGNDLRRLQDDVAQHTEDLHKLRSELDDLTSKVDSLAGGIEVRLKSTNVPNDPGLLGDWNQAETQLNRAGESILRLNNIASWATSDAALASYVVQAIRAAQGDPGMSNADRRQLAQLASDADRASGSVDQLVTETSGEIASRNLFVATAHRRLAALEQDIAAGRRAATAATPPSRAKAAAPTALAAGAAPGRRALVTIHFDRPDVAYEDELFRAMQEALARRPDAAFDIVAVTPPGAAASSSERNVESVVHSLGAMGLPADRFRLSAATLAGASGNEVRIYVR